MINPKDSNLYSIECERHSLSGLCKFPAILPEIDLWVKEEDFVNTAHQTIFLALRQLILKNQKPDKVLLGTAISNAGIKFKDDIDIYSYIESLFLSQITKEAAIQAFQELVKLRIRREIINTARNIALFVKKSGDKNIDEIIAECDREYGKTITSFRNSSNEKPENIIESLEETIENIGNNPPDPSKYPLGPFITVNRMFGSLVKRGQITLICSRSGVGKTSLGFYYLSEIAKNYNLPILHLDFGEMSQLELQMRAVCCFSKGIVPYHSLETGNWRKNPFLVQEVRKIWPTVKNLKVYYKDISFMGPSEIEGYIRRFTYTHIGSDFSKDDLKFIIHYDYLKPFQFDPHVPEYKEMGHFIQRIKALVKEEVPASFWCSLQSNKSGITTNKSPKDIDDSENIFSISDRIIQQTTHSFILRYKILDEITEESNEFGNLALIPVKHRHLGQDFQDVILPVKTISGRFKKNYINLNTNSFYFEDKGDLKDMTEKLKEKAEIQENDNKDGKNSELSL